MRNRPWIVAVITLAVLIVVTYAHNLLALFAAYRNLHRAVPFYYVESIDKIGEATLCVLAIWFMRRAGPRDVFRELGLYAPILPAIAFALVVSLPMLIGFASTRNLTPRLEILPVLFLTVFSPFVEEFVMRGFGILQLHHGTGWPFWIIVWPSAILFGLGHIEQGQSLLESVGLFFLLGSGGVLFGWLVYRWQSLWVPLMLHICMNLWWELFSVSRNAIGGWLPFALQILTLLFAIAVTFHFTRPRMSGAPEAA